MSCNRSGSCGSDPTLLWLWCRPAAAALIWLLARGYATGVAVRKEKTHFPPNRKPLLHLIWCLSSQTCFCAKSALYVVCVCMFNFNILFGSVSIYLKLLFKSMPFFFFLFSVAPVAYGSSQARELQLQAYTTARATWDLSCICDLHCSLQ